MNLTEATIKALYDGLTDDKNVSGVDGIIDDVLVITDPEISTDEYNEVIERAQEIVDDTPEGNIPFMDDYIGEYLQTCPICGTTFAEDHMLEPGAACPICLEQPDSFVMVGKIEAEEMVAVDNGIEEEMTDEDIDMARLEKEFGIEEQPNEDESMDVEPVEDDELDDDVKVKDTASKHIDGNKLEETLNIEPELVEESKDDVKTLKQQLLDVLPAEDVDTHESDLYVRISDKANEILEPFIKQYPYLVSKFRDEIDGVMWYEIIMGNAEDHYKEKYGKVAESLTNKLTEASSTYTYGDLVSIAEDEWGDDVIIDGTEVDGIYDVQTARHGGYLVDINLYPELAEFGAKTRHENINAFEEDYEALKVLWLFPQLLRDKEAKWLTADNVVKYDADKKFITKFPERKVESIGDSIDGIEIGDESKYELIDADDTMISELESNSALTWEGSIITPEVLEKLVDTLEQETEISVPVKFYTWTGDVMNTKYALTDKNAYPKDLNFLAISTDSWSDINKASTFKSKCDARWLDDIVDSNAERQARIDGNEVLEENWNSVYEESYDRQSLTNKIIGG